MKWLILGILFVAVACATPAQDFDTNHRRCFNLSAPDFDLRLEACDWLVHSGQLQENEIPRAYNNRGNAHARRGEYDQAIADYDAVVRLKPDIAETYNNRCSAYRQKHEYDRAIADCDTAIRLRPNYANAYNTRGLAYLSKRQYVRAIAEFDAAIRYKPDYAKAYNNRGLAYDKQGRMDTALRDYRRGYDLGHRPKVVVEKLKQHGRLP